MAEVTGDLGGQPIQLNNAATEATLKQLLAAMTVIANNTGKDKAAQAKSQQELEKELKKLAAASKKQAAEQEKLTKEVEEATEAEKKSNDEKKKKLDADKKAIKAQQEYIAQLNGVKNAMSGLGSAVAGAATGMTNMLSSLSNLGNSLTSTAAVFSSIPVVGGVLGSMFGAVAGAAEKTYEAFKKSASVGANFGGSMTEMMDAATGAGLTFEQFSGIIAKTGKDLALLGGDSEAGARRLASLGKQIKGTTLAGDLNRLGYSTEAINEGMASYAAQLAKTGALQGMSDAQLVASTGAYLKDLDALTKLTGKNKQEIESERNARLKDAQFRLIMSKMDVESQKNLQNLMDSIPAEHQEGMKEIIATGTATSEAGKKALAFLPDSAKNMMQLNQQIRTTGKLGADQANQLNAAYQRETQAFVKSGVAENMALYGDEASKRFFVGAADAAAREKNLAQITAEQQKAAAERKAKEEELKSKGLDPASMEAYKNKIAETSNEFTKFLANSGMLDIMMEAFATLVDIVELVVVPAFQYVVDNFSTIAMVVGGAYAAFLALKGLIFAANVKLALQTLAMTANTTAAGANVVATNAASLSMARLSAAMLPLLVPFIKIAAVGLLLYAGFKAIYNAGWDLGTIFEAIGDNFKSVILTITDGFLWLIEKLTPNASDVNKKIKEAQKGIEVERQALKEKEKARDAQRAANRVSRDTKREGDEELAATVESTETKKEDTVAGRRAQRQKEKELEASEKARKAQEAAADAAKKAADASTSTPGINLSSPQAMFDSMVKQQQGGTAGPTNQPGATVASSGGGGASSTAIGTGLGAIAEKYETGGRGSGTVGWDKVGGTSYGKKQISSKTGAMTDYLKFLDKTGKGDVAKQLREAGIEKDTGSTSGKAVDVWKKLAASGALGDSESEFLKTQSFDVAKKGIKDKDLQARIDGSRALQEMLYSTAVQHGPGGAMKIMNSVFKPGMSDEDLVKAVYKERGTKFSGSTANVQAGVLKRFGNEEKDIMALLKTGGAPAPATAPASASTPTTNVPNAAAVQTAVAQPPASTTTPPTTEAARAAAAANDPRRTDRAPTAVAGARQETPESLLASLNTKMDQLIAINRSLKDTNERQLSRLGSIAQSDNLYTPGA
jgi:flagellar biosynthesis GTPase FlhF